MKRLFNICKSISIIHHINRMRDKNRMVISISTKKASDKIQRLPTISALNNVGSEEPYLDIRTTIYDVLTANTILNDRKLKATQDK